MQKWQQDESNRVAHVSEPAAKKSKAARSASATKPKADRNAEPKVPKVAKMLAAASPTAAPAPAAPAEAAADAPSVARHKSSDPTWSRLGGAEQPPTCGVQVPAHEAPNGTKLPAAWDCVEYVRIGGTQNGKVDRIWLAPVEPSSNPNVPDGARRRFKSLVQVPSNARSTERA